MKRLLILGLALILLGLSAAAEGWVCPVCGANNTGNFCPNDGTARPASLSGGATSASGRYAYVPATLNRKLATRTGPGTQYDEPGSFLSAGHRVTVLSKGWDERNEIWWVQVAFSERGTKYRAYTGLKRFSDLDISQVPEDIVLGECDIPQAVRDCYYGPGQGFGRVGRSVPAGVHCLIYGFENDPSTDTDYIQIEFYDAQADRLRRAWIPEWYSHNEYMYYGW